MPISAYEAERMGFIKLSYDESKFHMPAGIKNELQKGASHKYIRKDGLEAIYELLIDADSGVQVKEIYNATRVITVKDHPDIGPTFNYSPNNGFITSDQSIAHYYFDILPFFWWGGVRSD